MNINSGFKFKIVLFFVLILLFSSKSFSQETKQSTATKQETPKRKNVLESYFENTTFKIKDEKGGIAAEKKFATLSLAEKKTLPNIFFEDRRLLSKEEIIEKLQKGGPEFLEIDIYKVKENKMIEDNKPVKAVNGIYQAADLTEKPTYPGGMQEFYKFVGHFYKQPKTPSNVLLKGKIYITFVVEKDGSLTDSKVLSDLGYGTGEEALRVLKMSQKWVPGKLNGEVVTAQYTLPMSIQDAN